MEGQVSYVFRQVRVRFWTAMLIYVMVVAMGVWLRDGWEQAPGWAGWAFAVVAATAAFFAVLIGPFAVSRLEGVEREVLLRSTALAFFVTMGAALFYGLLEAFARAPSVSTWWVWGIGMGTYALASIVLQRRLR